MPKQHEKTDKVNFLVTWSIDIGASSYLEAAQLALKIQRDPESIATVFSVTPEYGEEHMVDVKDSLASEDYPDIN